MRSKREMVPMTDVSNAGTNVYSLRCGHSWLR